MWQMPVMRDRGLECSLGLMHQGILLSSVPAFRAACLGLGLALPLSLPLLFLRVRLACRNGQTDVAVSSRSPGCHGGSRLNQALRLLCPMPVPPITNRLRSSSQGLGFHKQTKDPEVVTLVSNSKAASQTGLPRENLCHHQPIPNSALHLAVTSCSVSI